jgi:hypothetical protein
VVIATVFLTIMGMIGGYVLGERHRDRLRAQETSQTQETAPDPGPASDSPSGRLCPTATQDTAAKLGFPTPLIQRLKIETDNESTAWICEDPNGKLYYQGKTGGLEADLVERINGLFLSDVVEDGDEYQATAADGARFVISRERLVVHLASGKTQTNRVTSVE